MSDTTRYKCPHCSSDLSDKSVKFPEGTRRIALYDRDKDCTTTYKCPDCKAEWPRSLGEVICAMETFDA